MSLLEKTGRIAKDNYVKNVKKLNIKDGDILILRNFSTSAQQTFGDALRKTFPWIKALVVNLPYGKFNINRFSDFQQHVVYNFLKAKFKESKN